MRFCRHVAQRGSDYLGRTLPWPARLGFALHLRMCRNCRRFLEQIRQTSRLLGNAPSPAVPPAIEDALVAAFNRHAAPSRQPRAQ